MNAKRRILVTGGSGFIGTRLVDELLAAGHELLNIDNKAPNKAEHMSYWRECDIMDLERMKEIFTMFVPQQVVHLAARVETEPHLVASDYVVNTDGSANVLEAIRSTPSVDRVVMTSTMFVHQYHGEPKHDEDFAPHTIYGESKIIMEQLTRKAELKADWTIIRPVNIWGPWHKRYPSEFWRVLREGKYMHPGKQPVMRCYGYVHSVVYQIMKILDAPREMIAGQVYYVGDKPIDLLDWVNGFSRRLLGRDVKIVPRLIVRSAALVGDVLQAAKVRFPITSSRYQSMTTTNYQEAIHKTLDTFGTPPYTLDAAIAETVAWLVEQDPTFWSPPKK